MKLHGCDKGSDVRSLTRKSLGTLGEWTAQRWFAQRGIRAEKAGHGRGDLILTNAHQIRVEVKTARRDMRGQFQFCLYRKIKGGRLCTDFRKADVVLLLLVEHDATVIMLSIPACDLNIKQIVISDLNTSKYRKYLVQESVQC